MLIKAFRIAYPEWQPRLCAEAEGDEIGGGTGGGGGGTGGGGSTGGGDDGGDPYKRLYEASQAALEKANADLNEHKAKIEKASAEDKKKLAAEEGKLKELVASMEAERDKFKGQLDFYVERDKKAASELFADLPKASQEKLSPLQDKLDVGTWLDLVKKEANTATLNSDEAPKVGKGNKTKHGATDRYKPQHAEYVTERTGLEVNYLPKMIQDTTKPGMTTLKLPVREFWGMLNKDEGIYRK